MSADLPESPAEPPPPNAGAGLTDLADQPLSLAFGFSMAVFALAPCAAAFEPWRMPGTSAC